MNGNGSETPQSTASIIGDMFGMGSLFKLVTDPGLMTATHQMIAAVIEGANSNRRIEAKLDRLLLALGHKIDDINDRFAAGLSPTALLEANRSLGDRGLAATGEPSDDGTGGAAAGARPAVGNVPGSVAGGQTAEVR